MKLPEVTIQQLLEAGVHFGHHKKRWNPKMEKYIFGVRNNIHIIDLRINLPLLYKSLESLYQISNKAGKILFKHKSPVAPKINKSKAAILEFG